MSNIQKTHYSFGTDEWRALSTYFLDFGSSQLSFYRPQPLRPPSPAQVLPTVNRSDEKAKWLSSSKRDFMNFIGDVNRDTYYGSQKSLQRVYLTNRGDARVPMADNEENEIITPRL